MSQENRLSIDYTRPHKFNGRSGSSSIILKVGRSTITELVLQEKQKKEQMDTKMVNYRPKG
jgi:hypothetical protein